MYIQSIVFALCCILSVSSHSPEDHNWIHWPKSGRNVACKKRMEKSFSPWKVDCCHHHIIPNKMLKYVWKNLWENIDHADMSKVRELIINTVSLSLPFTNPSTRETMTMNEERNNILHLPPTDLQEKYEVAFRWNPNNLMIGPRTYDKNVQEVSKTTAFRGDDPEDFYPKSEPAKNRIDKFPLTFESEHQQLLRNAFTISKVFTNRKKKSENEMRQIIVDVVDAFNVLSLYQYTLEENLENLSRNWQVSLVTKDRGSFTLATSGSTPTATSGGTSINGELGNFVLCQYFIFLQLALGLII